MLSLVYVLILPYIFTCKFAEVLVLWINWQIEVKLQRNFNIQWCVLKCFCKIKWKFNFCFCLQCSNFEKPLFLHCDASSYHRTWIVSSFRFYIAFYTFYERYTIYGNNRQLTTVHASLKWFLYINNPSAHFSINFGYSSQKRFSTFSTWCLVSY